MFKSPGSALGFLIIVSLAIRIAWAAGLETTNDESYHYLYTVHPDLSYFDHPPMTMWVAKVGLLLSGGGVTTLSLRLGFVLLFAASTWVLYRWTARWYGTWAGVYAAAALNLTAFFPAAIGSFALPDGPFLFFALLTMWALSEALVAHPNRVWPWLLVGLAWGGALLSKYHAVLLPMAAFLYIVVTPAARQLLLRPGPYLGFALGCAAFAPVLIWNSNHHWASFLFQGGRAVGSQFKPQGLLAMLAGPIALLLPWIWFPIVSLLLARLRVFRELRGIERLLVCFAVVPFCLFGVVSMMRAILVHWPLIGFVPLFVLLGAKWAERSEHQPILIRRRLAAMTAASIIIASGVFAQARFGVVAFPNRDPLEEMSGWESVGAELARRGLLDDAHAFIFTPQWYHSGQLAFAVRNQVPVLCYNGCDARGFAYWSEPAEWLNHDGWLILVDDHERDVEHYRPYFHDIVKEADFPMTRSGKPFRRVHLYRCTEQIVPFPYQYPVPKPAATREIATARK